MTTIDLPSITPGVRESLITSWAGMRGVVTLAAALTMPEDTPYRSVLILVALAVALGTLLVQGLTLPGLARKACAQAGIEPAELAAFVPHQANLRITESVVKALALPDSVVVARDVVDSGNTSAASVPLATSTPIGPTRRIASATLFGSSPPASTIG